MNIDTRHRRLRHKQENTKVHSIDKGNRNSCSPWRTTEINDIYSHDKYSDSIVNPIDDGSDSHSTNKNYYFKTPPRTLTVQNRYLNGDASSGGASTTDDGSSSMQRSARRAIARSRRAALENYKALTSQITQITEDETPYVSVKRSTSRVPASSFSSFSTWETDDSMVDPEQAQVIINATPSTHRRITEKLIQKDLSTMDGGDDSNSDDDSFVMKNTTSYTSFSRGIPATVRSVDSDDSGTLFDKLFACCPPSTTFYDQNEDFQDVFQKLENEKHQNEVYTYFK
jgi:hypothetical protein